MAILNMRISPELILKTRPSRTCLSSLAVLLSLAGQVSGDGGPVHLSAADLLASWRMTKEAIHDIAVDVQVIQYDTFAHLMTNGSVVLQPERTEDIAERIELPPHEWIAGVPRRFSWQIAGEIWRVETARNSVIADARGTEEVEVRSVCVFDGTTSRETLVSRPSGKIRHGRVFSGPPRTYFHPYDLCFTSDQTNLLLPQAEDEHRRLESGGKAEHINGYTTYRLSLYSKVLDQTLWSAWLDPEAGWLPRRMERYIAKDGGDRELLALQRLEILEIGQISEGIWFPLVAEEATFLPGLADPSQLIMVTKRYITVEPATLKINKSLDAEQLALEWPVGTLVADETTRTGYQIGENAEKVMEVHLGELRKQVQADAQAELFQASRATGDSQTQSIAPRYTADGAVHPRWHAEPTIWGWVGALIAAGLGFISTIALIQRRRGN